MNFSFCLWNYHVWEFPIPLVYTSKSFYNSGSFSKIFSNLCKPTDNNLKLVLFVLFFCFLYSIVWRFSVSDTFYFLGRLIWKIDKTFFTIFQLHFFDPDCLTVLILLSGLPVQVLNVLVLLRSLDSPFLLLICYYL